MRNRRRREIFTLLLAATLVAGVFVVTPSVGEAAPDSGVTVQLAVCLDGSNEVSDDDFEMIIDGLATAVQTTVIPPPHDGSVELTVVQFAGTTATVEVGPVVINQATAKVTANQIRKIEKRWGNAPMAAGIDMATSAIIGSSHFPKANRQVINISTNGYPNYPCSQSGCVATGKDAAIAARKNAVTAGIDEIDVEAIGYCDNSTITWMLDSLVWPLPGVVVVPHFPHTPRAPDTAFYGFVCKVESFAEYLYAIIEKFSVVTGTHDPLEPLESFENLLKSQAGLLKGFEDLLHRLWPELTSQEREGFLGSLKDRLTSQEERIGSFEGMLTENWGELEPGARTKFLSNLEDLLGSQEELLKGFEELLKQHLEPSKTNVNADHGMM